MRQALRGSGALPHSLRPHLWPLVYWNRQCQVILRAWFTPQIKHPQVRVPPHRSHHIRMMRTELRRVDTRMYRQRYQTLLPLRLPHLHRAVPARAKKCILLDQIPMGAEHLSAMFLPSRNRKLADADIEELDAPVAACGQELILMLFGPGKVEEAILCFEVLFTCDAVGGQIENIETSISNETKVGAARDGDTGVEEGRVFYGVGIKALGAKFEHFGGRL